MARSVLRRRPGERTVCAHEVSRGTVGVGRDVRVEVEDEPPGRVAETMLCGPDVGAGGDPRGRGRVAKAVERQPAEVSLGDCRRPYAGTEERVPQRATLRRGEEPRVGVLGREAATAHVFGELGDQGLGGRARSAAGPP